jgi:mannose/fructose/N-acetylgalactosamine-specific phosphotransferase system component IIB
VPDPLGDHGLPDEVREKDYEMDLFDVPRKIKKIPSPIKHLLKELVFLLIVPSLTHVYFLIRCQIPWATTAVAGEEHNEGETQVEQDQDMGQLSAG